MLILTVAFLGAIMAHRPALGLALALLLGRQEFRAGVSMPLVALPIIMGLGVVLYERRLQPPPTFVWLPLLGYGLAATTRSILSPGGSLGASIGLYVLFGLLPMTFIASSIFSRPNAKRDFVAAMVGLGVSLSAIAIATSDGARAGALGGGPITLAQAAALAAILLLCNVGNVCSLAPRALNYGALAFLTYAVIWSQSRGPTIALFVAFAAYGANSGSTHLRKGRLLLAGASTVPAFLLLDRLGYLPRRLSRLGEFGTEVARSRGIVWNPAIDAIKENPILGCGIDCYFLETGSTFTYPHNLFLEVLVVGGLPLGIVLAIAVYKMFASVGHRSAVELPVLLVPFLSSMFSGDFFNNRSLWVTACLLLAGGLANGEATPEKSPLTKVQSRSFAAQGNPS